MTIADITSRNIGQQKFLKELPKVYQLKNVFENNDWHHETTFEHTILVLKKLNSYLATHTQVAAKLTVKIDEYQKADLLKLVALLHDTGKFFTLVKKPNGLTDFPGHEIISYKKSQASVKKFDLSTREKKYVLELIKNHGHLHYILDSSKNLESQIKLLRKKCQPFFYELVFFCLIDTISSKLKKNNKSSYLFRLRVYRTLLKAST